MIDNLLAYLYSLHVDPPRYGDSAVLDYRFHFAHLAAEDRLRPRRPTEATHPAPRVHRRESPRAAPASPRR